jgi:hypothetical protein
VLPSWLFCAVLWPCWALGKLTGLFVWRWLTTLAIFLTCLLTARRSGARGLGPILVIAVCGLIFRFRSQVRPETLASLLMVVELYLLEARRQGGRDRTRWIVPLACLWINVHISYYLCFVLLVAYQAPWASPRGVRAVPRERMRRDLLLTTLAAAAACLVNPFGWRAMAQPFDYFFHWRHEPLYTTIAELHGIDWGFHSRDGLLVLMLLWPALQLWRAIERRGDLVEATLWGTFTALAWFNQRFVGTWALMAAVFLSRDAAWLLNERWLAARRIPDRLLAPIASALCILLCVPEWSRADLQPGFGVDPLSAPVSACDFLAQHGIRGRIFNDFELGGYLLWRFWPERDRLPFMDIHQSGTPQIRLVYEAMLSNRDVWQRASGKLGFEVAILKRVHARGEDLLNILDADSTWTMVFADDVAAIYLRRPDSLGAQANPLAYRVVPGGMHRLALVGEQVEHDPAVRAGFRRELERIVGESTANSSAHSLLATLDMREGRWEAARTHLTLAHRVDPLLPLYFTRTAYVDQNERRWNAALGNFERAKHAGELRDLDAVTAPILEQLGDLNKAHRAYEAALRRDPANAALREGAARTAR